MHEFEFLFTLIGTEIKRTAQIYAVQEAAQGPTKSTRPQESRIFESVTVSGATCYRRIEGMGF